MDIPRTIMSRLWALKLEPEAMSAVLEIIDEIQAPIEKRRERDKLRKRQFRGQSADIPRTPPHPPNKNINKYIPKPGLSADKRKHELPEGWQPSESDLEYGKKLGLLNGRCEGQVEAMRLWAKANRILKVDWHATLKGFLRREAEKIGSANSLDKAFNSSKRESWRIGSDGKWTKDAP